MRSSPFFDGTRRRLVVTDVSGQPIGLRYVRSQKSQGLEWTFVYIRGRNITSRTLRHVGETGIALSFANSAVVGGESAVVGGDWTVVGGESAVVGGDSAVVGV